MPGIWRTVDILTLKYTYFASHCFGQISVLATIFVFVILLTLSRLYCVSYFVG